MKSLSVSFFFNFTIIYLGLRCVPILLLTKRMCSTTSEVYSQRQELHQWKKKKCFCQIMGLSYLFLPGDTGRHKMCIKCLGANKKTQVHLGGKQMEEPSPDIIHSRSQMSLHLQKLSSTDSANIPRYETLLLTQLTGHLDVPIKFSFRPVVLT